jgi:soluble lytic murein transglycosylase-like protein
MAVDSVVASAASQVTGAIRQAAHSTGASFEYLLTTARIESNLNPAAPAPTSTASGLDQLSTRPGSRP